MLLIAEAADGGCGIGDNALTLTMRNPTAGRAFTVSPSGRGVPPSTHDDVGGGKTPPKRNTIMAPRPSQPGPPPGFGLLRAARA